MARWDLFREMDNLRRDIDSAFRDFGLTRYGQAGFLPGVGLTSYPQINLAEDKDNIYVEALVPGVDPKDLELTVMRGTLTLQGKRRETEAQKKAWHRNERGGGRFLRTIEIPAEVEADKVNAEYRNGVLTATLPKAEMAKPKKIDVKVG